MASPLDSALDPIKICVDGLRLLVKAIKSSRDAGNSPLIVTISRRMPHILFWFKHTYASEKEKSILDATEIITEIALPFINFSRSAEKTEIFLIDDVIVSGKTFRYVLGLIQYMAKSVPVKSYVIFCDRYSRFLFSHGSKVNVGYKYTGSEEKKIIFEFISSVIAITLPIDVTYPIFYLANPSDVEYLKSDKYWFREPNGKDVDNYETCVKCKMDIRVADRLEKAGTVNYVYTSLLPSAISNSINNDFAKIRSYKRLGKFIVVSYAPNILSDSNLRDPELFEASEYKAIWKIALESVNNDYFYEYDLFDEDSQSKELINNRCYRSLVSIANYLYSLSTFNKLMKSKIEEREIEAGHALPVFKIEKEDLQLIVGKNVTEKIISLLSEIIDKKIVSPRQHKKIEVQTTFIPWMFENDYELSKYLSLLIGEDDYSSNLHAIFRNASDKQDSYPVLLTEDVEFDVEGIMESFASLQSTLNATTHQKQVDIYKWVDEQIDNATIVSRYANVVDSNEERYWRRFFRLSSSFVD